MCPYESKLNVCLLAMSSTGSRIVSTVGWHVMSMLELLRKFKLWLTILTVLSSESTSAKTIVSSVIPIFAFSSILTGDRGTRTTGTWIWKIYVSKIRSRTNNCSIPNIYANKYNGKISPLSNPLSMQENFMKLARPINCLAARMVYMVEGVSARISKRD